MTPEQRYRLELAKDRAPSTNVFVWFIPAFFIFAWICRADLPIEEHQQPAQEVNLLKTLGIL